MLKEILNTMKSVKNYELGMGLCMTYDNTIIAHITA